MFQPTNILFAITLRIYALLLVANILYNSFSPRILPGQKELFAVLIFIALVAALPLIIKNIATIKLIFAILLLNILWLVLMIWHEPIVIRWVISDFVVVTAPLYILSLLQAGSYNWINSFQARLLRTLLPALCCAAIIAPLFPDQLDRGRFEPPDVLLMALLSSYICFERSATRRYLAIFSYCILLLLAYYSQWRMAMMIALMMPLVFLLIRFKYRYVSLLIVSISLWSLVVDGTVFQTLEKSTLLQETRFSSLLSGDLLGDRSAIFRLIELQHVWAYLMENNNTIRWIVGNGHGAHFPSSGLTGDVTLQYYEKNVVGNRVHNVHIGAGWILLRYGLIGLTLYGVMLFSVTRRLWSESIEISHFQRACLASCFLYLVTTLTLYNEWHHSTFHLVLAFALYRHNDVNKT